MTKHKPSPIGAQTFGRMQPTKRVTGLTAAELACVVAVMACERVHGAPPTRNAIADVAECDDTTMPSKLVRDGWLVRAGTTDGRAALYLASERAWAELGFRDATQAGAAE